MDPNEEKPRVVEGIVLDRDGTPLVTPAESARGPQQPFAAGMKLLKPSPLLIAGALVAIPVVLALLFFAAAVMLVFTLFMTLITGKRPRIVQFSKFSNFSNFKRR